MLMEAEEMGLLRMGDRLLERMGGPIFAPFHISGHSSASVAGDARGER